MSYTKYTWVTGEVITADKLNHMEDGIAGAYTVAALEFDDAKYIVKATPDTIDSVFAAVGTNDATGESVVIYRILSGSDEHAAYASFMGIPTGSTPTAQDFIYEEEEGGYVWNSGDLG